MSIYLRQSTASQELLLGQFVDETDGFTAEAGLTIANTDIKLAKTGVLTLASKNSGGATIVSNAVYSMTLDATDTDTIGPMQIFVHVAGARPVRVECCVLDEAVYDAMFGTSAPLVAGNNGATNFTAGITITQSTANTPGLSITGNGTGDGIKAMSGSGATGDGICAVAASTNGNGLQAQGTGTADGLRAIGGATGRGIAGTGGATSGDGIVGTSTTLGHGIRGIGVGSAKHGFLGNAGTNASGMSLVGAGTGHGLLLTAGASGKGLQADTITVSGATTLTGAVALSSTLDIAGTVTCVAVTTSGTVTFNAFNVSNATVLSGSVTASHASNNIGGVTVAALGGDTITASALAASAVTEIQSGLATSSGLAALNNLSAAQVNAEVIDCLNADTYAEIGQETPAATTTYGKMLRYLYKWLRNKKTQTATQVSLMADDGATVDQKATVSDSAGTTTIGELTTGP